MHVPPVGGGEELPVTGGGRCNGRDVHSLGNTSHIEGHPTIVFNSSNVRNYRRSIFRVVDGSVSRTERNEKGGVIIAHFRSYSMRVRSFNTNVPISFGGTRGRRG